MRRAMKTLGLLIVIFFVAPSVCIAQAAKKIPVAVNHIGDDQVGQSYASALKEAIRGSKSFVLVDHEVPPKSPRIVVHIVSDKGVSSAIAVVKVYDDPKTPGNGIYLHSSIISCSTDMVESCAKLTLSDIDRTVEEFRKLEPNLSKTL